MLTMQCNNFRVEADFLDKYKNTIFASNPPPPRNPNKKFLSVTVLCCSVFYTVEGANMRAGAVSGRGARKLPRVFISSFFQFLPISPVCEVQHTLLKKYLAVPTTSSKYLNVA